MSDTPTNLIYGLIDPRTLLVRYVGLSSTGRLSEREMLVALAADG